MQPRFGFLVAAIAALLPAAPVGAAGVVPPQAVVAELPFLHREVPNRVIVDLMPTASRHPVPLVLDTGASETFLTPLLARGLGISLQGKADLVHRRPTRLGRTLRFRVDTRAADPSSEIHFEHGILGGDFLSHYVVDLDFSMRRVRFLDPDRFRVAERAGSADEAVLPIRITEKRPRVRISVDARPVWALIDTGDPSSLMITSALAAELGVTAKNVQGLKLWSMRGPLPVGLGQVDEVDLGGHRFRGVPVLVRAAGDDPSEGGGVLIGFDLLSRFHARIDYPRKRLWLKLRPEQSATFLGHPWAPIRESGAVVERGHPLEVRYVVEGSPAWSLGLRPGDRIRPSSVSGPGDPVEELAARIRSGGPVAVMRPDGAGGFAAHRLSRRADDLAPP